MSTLDRYRYQQTPSDCFDKLTSYSSTAALFFGLLLLITGIFSFSLGVASICVLASASFIGYGIFCGIFFSIAGVLTMVSGCFRSACMVMISMVMSMLTVFMAGVQFSLGILAAYTDSHRTSLSNMAYFESRIAYDIFNPKNVYPNLLCIGSNYNWSNAWAPVDILLIIGAFFAMVLAFVISALACSAICNGNKMLNNPHGMANAGFAHEIYMTQPKNAPPVYKLTM